MEQITEEVEFYAQRLKEAQSKLYTLNKKNLKKAKKTKVLDQKITDKFSMYNGDCIEVIQGMPDESIHYSIFSPPFASLFTYSDSIRDMGNSADGPEFKDHFDYLIPELYRVLMPGRLITIHCMDIPAMKERDGYIGLKDFPGMLLKQFEKVGFIYHSKVQIKKNELMEAQRTKAIGLMHKQMVKDSAMCRNALPDYLITLRKPGNNPEPVQHPNGFEYYIGSKADPDRPKSEIQGLNRFSQKIWQRYASSVWLDIRQTNTLNIGQAREEKDEKHICPLQLDVIARCLELWTNKGDVVLSPFTGIGSEGHTAIAMRRKFIGIELKESYYKQALKYLKRATKSKKGLFDA